MDLTDVSPKSRCIIFYCRECETFVDTEKLCDHSKHLRSVKAVDSSFKKEEMSVENLNLNFEYLAYKVWRCFQRKLANEDYSGEDVNQLTETCLENTCQEMAAFMKEKNTAIKNQILTSLNQIPQYSSVLAKVHSINSQLNKALDKQHQPKTTLKQTPHPSKNPHSAIQKLLKPNVFKKAPISNHPNSPKNKKKKKSDKQKTQNQNDESKKRKQPEQKSKVLEWETAQGSTASSIEKRKIKKETKYESSPLLVLSPSTPSSLISLNDLVKVKALASPKNEEKKNEKKDKDCIQYNDMIFYEEDSICINGEDDRVYYGKILKFIDHDYGKEWSEFDKCLQIAWYYIKRDINKYKFKMTQKILNCLGENELFLTNHEELIPLETVLEPIEVFPLKKFLSKEIESDAFLMRAKIDIHKGKLVPSPAKWMTVSCCGNYVDPKKDTFQCINCNQYFHKDCLDPNDNTLEENSPVCTNCKSKGLQKSLVGNKKKKTHNFVSIPISSDSESEFL